MNLQTVSVIDAGTALPSEQPAPGGNDGSIQEGTIASALTDEDPLEAAMKTPCPIVKYSGKTLGDLITTDPNAIVWVATKFQGNPDISAAASLICDHALAAATA